MTGGRLLNLPAYFLVSSLGKILYPFSSIECGSEFAELIRGWPSRPILDYWCLNCQHWNAARTEAGPTDHVLTRSRSALCTME
jgi:hypothetical protein